MRTALMVCLLLPGLAWARESAEFPIGDSDQVFREIPFALRVPPKEEGAARGLILLLPGSLGDLDALRAAPWAVLAPRVPDDRTSGLWSAGETKTILALVEHVRKALGVPRTRVHAVAIDKTSLHDIFEPVVFRKRSPFVSATWVRSVLLRASVPSDARKRMGVLAYDWEPGPHDQDGVRPLYDRMEGKVRVAELRASEEPLSEPYFRYWLEVMSGDFIPGHDLSLPWIEEVKDAKALQALQAAEKRPALVYVYEAADAASKDAQRIQHELFFDRAVREAARGALCVKLDRASAPETCAALGVTSTPALVVLDTEGTASKPLVGRVKARALIKALTRAAKRPTR